MKPLMKSSGGKCWSQSRQAVQNHVWAYSHFTKQAMVIPFIPKMARIVLLGRLSCKHTLIQTYLFPQVIKNKHTLTHRGR